jgi:hypothetical protein
MRMGSKGNASGQHNNNHFIDPDLTIMVWGDSEPLIARKASITIMQ